MMYWSIKGVVTWCSFLFSFFFSVLCSC